MADQSPLHPMVYIVLGLVLLTSVFLFDLLQPLGVAAGVPYAALVMFGLLLHSRLFLLCMAVAGTTLTMLGFYSQTTDVDIQIVATNRALAVFLIWTAAAIGLRQLAYQDRISDLEAAQNIDPLTGLINRKGLFNIVADLIKTTRQENSVVSIAVFDFDNFKAVNDGFGHLAGDTVLQNLALLLQRNKAFHAARLGGEEFVLIMPGKSLSAATKEANAVLDAVHALNFTWEGQPVGLSLSVGIAALDESMHNNLDLIRTADDALYRAKRKGGNRIALAEQSALPD